MEAANVVAVPAAMVFLSGGALGAASFFAIAVMMALLAVGAAYWRAKHNWLVYRQPITPAVRLAARLKLPLLMATIAATTIAAAAWLLPGIAPRRPDQIVASIAALLAVLEYINYYHRQLQHFDRAADFRRLLTGRGFRKSQLARDIERLA